MAWDIIAGALGLGGSLYAGSANRKAASAAQQKQIDFEKWKLSNYHQQEVMDLRKAGLNPMLSVQHATPVGGVAAPYGEQDNPGESGVRSYSAAQQARQARRQVDIQEMLANTQSKLNSAQAQREADQSELIKAQTTKIPYEIDLTTASAQQARQYAQYLSSSMQVQRSEIMKNEANIRQLQKELDVMQQRINESKTAQSKMVAETRFTQTRELMEREQIRTEQLRREQVVLENKARELGMPRKEIEALAVGGFKGTAQTIAEYVAEGVTSGFGARDRDDLADIFMAQQAAKAAERRREYRKGPQWLDKIK